MKPKFPTVAGAAVAAVLILGTFHPASALAEPSHERFGVEKTVNRMTDIRIKTLQDESLGSIADLAIDLVNGRIVEVLVDTDTSLGVGDKLVAVPPLALIADPKGDVFRINVSADVFKSAPGIDLAKWTDAGRSDRIAATYRRFGQEPYFLENGETADAAAARPKVLLGYVELSNRMLGLPVGNFQNEKLGTVCSMSLNIPRGRILEVIVLAQDDPNTKSVIPAMALSFNSARDGLLLDDSKLEYRDEPRYVLTKEAYGHGPYSKEESYKGPHTDMPLEQGVSYRDVDRTHRIYDEIRAAKINDENVRVGTINGRTTLRGWVDTQEEKVRIFEIAVAASRVEVVDNQIVVRPPSAVN
jgi:sporulation protein YlmC with PRC-barrel domain